MLADIGGCEEIGKDGIFTYEPYERISIIEGREIDSNNVKESDVVWGVGIIFIELLGANIDHIFNNIIEFKKDEYAEDAYDIYLQDEIFRNVFDLLEDFNYNNLVSKVREKYDEKETEKEIANTIIYMIEDMIKGTLSQKPDNRNSLSKILEALLYFKSQIT